MMPLKHIFKNKLLLQKNFNLQEYSIDRWQFWQFEENIKIVNEILEEEDKNNKEGEENSSLPNVDMNGMMKNASSMMNNTPKF